jgi:hypothetical protein
MEAVCSSETLASTNKSTRRYYPEDQHRYLHRRENLKCRAFLPYLNALLQLRWMASKGSKTVNDVGSRRKLVGLMKLTKTQNSRPPGRESKPGHPEHKVGVLTTRSRS